MKNIEKVWWTAVIALAAILFTIFPSGIRAAEKIGAANEPRAYAEWIPVPGRVTMIDLGATECIPCKMMAPILAELQREYDGRADIVFIDVWKNPAQKERYRLRAIPTQIFFDAQGKEVRRHLGFMDKKSIVAILSELGVK